MKERVILHSDLNNFYASVEIKERPEIKDNFVIVCGSIEDRHGIVLAKNEKAKKAGVKTGMTIHEAEKLCPNLVKIEAEMDKYIEYSVKVREIYSRYTGLIEPFGIDESWLDVTSALRIFGSGENIAEEIRQKVKEEIGLTVSIGVSFNKVFAKLASDLKKPDAVTVVSRDNFKTKVWDLPVENLLYVGKSTLEKLKRVNVTTIKDLASFEVVALKKLLGKWGEVLHSYANGMDESPVINGELDSIIKSVGNSITCYRDLEDFEDAKMVFYILAESIAERVKKYNLGKATTVSITVKDNELNSSSRQMKTRMPIFLSNEICDYAMELFKENYDFSVFIRSLGISLSGFTKENLQMNSFEEKVDFEKLEKNKEFETCVIDLKKKYGKDIIKRGIVLTDRKMSEKDIADKPIFK